MVKVLAKLLLGVGFIGVMFGLASCRGFQEDKVDQTTLPNIQASERSIYATAFGAGIFLVGLYLNAKVPKGQSVVAADIAVVRAWFCPECKKALRPAQCARGRRFGPVPRMTCPDCGASVERSGARITLVGLVLLAGFLLPIGCLGFPPVPDFVEEAGVICFLIGIPVFIVGLLRMDRQPRRLQDYGTERK